VDTTTITTGLGLLAWVVVIRPAATDAALPLLTRAVQVSYPVGDLILLAMIVRLLRGGGTRSAAHRWMASSVGAFLLGDTAWAVYGATGADPTGLSLRVLSGVFVMAYSLLAMAALHPAAREISQPMPPAEPRLSVVQLVTLAMVSLIAPAILAVQVYQQATSGERITDGGAIVIGSSALFLLVVVRMAQLLREVEKQALKVRHLARSDELTGLPNRRAWNDEIPRALEQACRDNTPVCVAMLDLDRFKAFNDTYGHPAGDRLLKSAAAAWHSALRTVDTLARYGGEEFVVLLPNVHPDQASAILARVKAATPLGQTFSAGLATWDGSENSDALIARADKALYAAKSSGRDRIVVACDNNDPALTPA
jgi:diguanylate cyclase (GGDEF)-like protein